MDSYTYYSFYITYSFLITTGTITFIEALRTNIVSMRHILNLETCISIIAAYFYGNFITMLAPMKKQIIDVNNTLNEIKSKTSSSSEASAVISSYLNT